MLKASENDEVRKMYDETADSYDSMMDSEIELPSYGDVLGRLAGRINNLSGPVIDTSVGSGHMLFKYREEYDPKRTLIGVDLSPRMVEIAGTRLGENTDIYVGNMLDLAAVESETAAAVISYFAIHHLDPEELLPAFTEWMRVLCPGGQLLVAAWEGVGPIDYGGEADIVAFRYTKSEIVIPAEAAGFRINRCTVEPVEGLPMDAVHIEGTRE